jgi:hypothetical protein
VSITLSLLFQWARGRKSKSMVVSLGTAQGSKLNNREVEETNDHE